MNFIEFIEFSVFVSLNESLLLCLLKFEWLFSMLNANVRYWQNTQYKYWCPYINVQILESNNELTINCSWNSRNNILNFDSIEKT